MARIATHPGEHLREQLEALEMNGAELAGKLRVPARRIEEILRGERAVSVDAARRLGRFFQTSAQFWLNLQAGYDAGRGSRNRRNPHIGSSLDDFLKEEGIYEGVQRVAKRAAGRKKRRGTRG